MRGHLQILLQCMMHGTLGFVAKGRDPLLQFSSCKGGLSVDMELNVIQDLRIELPRPSRPLLPREDEVLWLAFEKPSYRIQPTAQASGNFTVADIS